MAIVKGELRSLMGQERLSKVSMLAIMSIKHEVLRNLDFADTIEEFALAIRLENINISSSSAAVAQY